MMGLIDHPLTPLIVAWMEAKLRFASYCTEDNRNVATVALNRLNAALEEYRSPNEDPSGQRREPMSPHPLDDEPPFEIQESK